MNPDDPLGLTGTKPQSNDPLGLLSSPHLPTKLELAKRNAATPHPEDLEEDDPSYAQQALGGIASLAHDIPGAEAAQAGARSLVRGQSYKDALSDIRGAEESAPSLVRHYNNIAGGTIAAAATPGSNVALQGARFGIAEAMGGADPESLKDRIDNIPVRATIDAALGKVLGEVAPNYVRSVAVKRLGKNVLDRTGVMAEADARNFGKAKAEGDLAAANPTPQVVSDALNDPDTKPYVAIIRGSGLFKGANDATVLREAHKLMGERERMLGNRIVGSDDYKAGSELERNEIIQGKRRLSDASKSIMPSFGPANLVHAQAEGQLDALKSAADATGRIVRGADVAGRKLESNSSDSFLRDILQMRDAEAKAATEGVLGKLKAKSSLSFNPLKGFGIPKTVSNVNKMSPYLSALDQQAGNDVLPPFLRHAGIALGESGN